MSRQTLLWSPTNTRPELHTRSWGVNSGHSGRLLSSQVVAGAFRMQHTHVYVGGVRAYSPGVLGSRAPPEQKPEALLGGRRSSSPATHISPPPDLHCSTDNQEGRKWQQKEGPGVQYQSGSAGRGAPWGP